MRSVGGATGMGRRVFNAKGSVDRINLSVFK